MIDSELVFEGAVELAREFVRDNFSIEFGFLDSNEDKIEKVAAVYSALSVAIRRNVEGLLKQEVNDEKVQD